MNSSRPQNRSLVPVPVRRSVKTAVALVIVAGLAACGSSASGSATGSAASPVKVQFAEAAAIDAGSVFGALEEGYFAQEKVTANVQLYPTGLEITNEVASGKAQFGTLAASVALTAKAKGLPIEIVAINHGDATATSYDANSAIVAGPGTGIKAGDVAALKGKKIGVTVATSPEAYLDSELTQHGLTPSDVQVQNMQPADMISALKQGSIAAFAAFEPVPSEAISQLPGSVVVTEGGATGWYDPGVVIVNTAWASAHPATTEDVLAAMTRAEQLGRQHPDKLAEIDTHWMTGVSLSVAETAIKHVEFDPRLSQDVLHSLQHVTVPYLVANSGVPASFNADSGVNGTYLAKVEQQYPQYFSDLTPLPAGQAVK